ncbi:MAG: Smr/MutS family protein [Syntrophobacteraceae bacterium]|jgi:dsDNA-specific endonuclease/ATPase MutS2|nr:Smr/MutS family protein [Syntrophobacteraceae bacterium]
MSYFNEIDELDGPTAQDAPEDEPLAIPIEEALDLHTFRPAEVGDLLDDYLEAAREKGFREVRIIHGKGSGQLRHRVQVILERHPLVVSFKPAEASRGGWGATVVTLKAGD